MTQQFAYQSGFQYSQAVIKGEKKYFVEGYISTIDEDDQGEIVTSQAQDSILAQVKGKQITMDLDHEEWVEDGELLNTPKQSMIPIAKIIHAERKPKGVWVKAELNKHSPRFKNILGSIKEGFLHSFSIGMYVTQAVTKSINGAIKNFIQGLNLINVTLTGCPINSNATFTPVMKAALKSLEENKMSEEVKPEPVEATPAVEEPKPAEPVVEEPKPAEPVVEEPKIDEEAINKLKEEVEAKTKEIAELVVKLEASEAKPPEPTPEAKEDHTPFAGIKSLAASLKAQNIEIAKLKAKLNEPVIKSLIVEQPKPGELEKQPTAFEQI